MPLRQAKARPLGAAAMLATKGSDSTGASIRTLNAVAQVTFVSRFDAGERFK